MEQAVVTIDWQDVEIEFEVDFSYHAAYRGARDSLGGRAGMGPPIEPDEPEGYEIQTVYYKGKECKHLKSEVWELIDEALVEVGQQMQQDAAESAAEAKYERWCEAQEARYNDYY